MTQHMMTITRFVSMAWDWMDEGAPDVDSQPDLFDRIEIDEPALSDLEVEPDLSWVGNFNHAHTTSH